MDVLVLQVGALCSELTCSPDRGEAHRLAVSRQPMAHVGACASRRAAHRAAWGWAQQLPAVAWPSSEKALLSKLRGLILANVRGAKPIGSTMEVPAERFNRADGIANGRFGEDEVPPAWSGV